MSRIIDLRKEKDKPEAVSSPAPALRSGKIAPNPRTTTSAVPHSESSVISRRERTVQWQVQYTRPKLSFRAKAFFLFFFMGVAGALWFWQKNALGALVIPLIAAVLVLRWRQTSRAQTITLGERGITIGEEEYRYEDLTSFWVDYNPVPGMPRQLILETKHWYTPLVHIPITSQNALMVRDFLFEFLLEKKHEPSFAEAIIARLGL